MVSLVQIQYPFSARNGFSLHLILLFPGGQSAEERGLSRHHTVSASWDGGDAGDEEGEVKSNQQQHIGELFQNDQARSQR